MCIMKKKKTRRKKRLSKSELEDSVLAVKLAIIRKTKTNNFV